MNMPTGILCNVASVVAGGFVGSIIGESVEDDLADRIFSEFCMGK